MAQRQTIFSEDFLESPYWWQQWRPHELSQAAVPTETDIAIIGGGYTGLCCALELANHGFQVTVFDAALPGEGASTLSGGQVTGGVNVGKSMVRKKHATSDDSALQQARLYEAAEGYRFLEALIARYGIDCDYRQSGRISAAWIPQQLESWKKKLLLLNEISHTDARMLSREEIRQELDTDIYAGGVLIKRAGQLNPARYYGGLLEAVKAAGVTVCSYAAVKKVEKLSAGHRLYSARGNCCARQVVIATNGYTGHEFPELRRRIVPVTSHQIATEPLPLELRNSLIPQRRGVAETQRVTHYFRYSPDGTRLLFGGRARFYPLSLRQSAEVLHRHLVERFPQLKEVKVGYSWGGKVAVTLDYLPHLGQTRDGCYYAAGCNGSGVTMMSWLGHRLARHLIDNEPLHLSPYGATPMPGHALYRGRTWFMPLLGSYYQIRDSLDKRTEKTS